MSCTCENTIADLSCLNVIAGDPLVLPWFWYNSDATLTDLAGYTAEMVGKMDPDATEYDFELDDTDGIEMGGTAGSTTTTIDTTNLSGRVYFRLTITPGGGGNTESLQGFFDVKERL